MASAFYDDQVSLWNGVRHFAGQLRRREAILPSDENKRRHCNRGQERTRIHAPDDGAFLAYEAVRAGFFRHGAHDPLKFRVGLPGRRNEHGPEG